MDRRKTRLTIILIILCYFFTTKSLFSKEVSFGDSIKLKLYYYYELKDIQDFDELKAKFPAIYPAITKIKGDFIYVHHPYIEPSVPYHKYFQIFNMDDCEKANNDSIIHVSQVMDMSFKKLLGIAEKDKYNIYQYNYLEETKYFIVSHNNRYYCLKYSVINKEFILIFEFRNFINFQNNSEHDIDFFYNEKVICLSNDYEKSFIIYSFEDKNIYYLNHNIEGIINTVGVLGDYLILYGKNGNLYKLTKNNKLSLISNKTFNDKSIWKYYLHNNILYSYYFDFKIFSLVIYTLKL